jgi:hypothetical protein
MPAFRYFTAKEQQKDKEKAKQEKIEGYKKQCIERCNSLTVKKGWTGEFLYKKKSPKSQKALSLKEGGRSKSRKNRASRKSRRTKKFFGLF